MLIISHSGGTFAPLAVSNLLQSTTKKIFLVTSEWDTQVGKQLRASTADKKGFGNMTSRIFSTGIGIHPAEPCSLSVVATHQLLTNILVYLMVRPRGRTFPLVSCSIPLSMLVLVQGTISGKGEEAMRRFGATFMKEDAGDIDRDICTAAYPNPCAPPFALL